jgi:hypothetical protein
MTPHKYKQKDAITYLHLEKDENSRFCGSITLSLEPFNPEEVAGEDVIISIFKRGHSVTLKSMANYDKKYIAFGILKYVREPLDKFRMMWQLYNSMDPDEIDMMMRIILDKIGYY